MTRLTVCVALGVLVTCAAPVFAQPWVPAQGEGTVSITYQNYDVRGHFDAFGRRNNNAGTLTQSLLTELDVGVTNKLALTVSLPVVAPKYTGPPEYFVGGHPTYPGPLDDGSYHVMVQDLRVELRRLWWIGPVAFAPLVAGLVPTHDYETHGEAVAGRHRKEATIGGSAGTDLGRILPRTSIWGRYALSSAEREHRFPSVRSNVDLEGDYGVTRKINVRALADWQFAHKGPTIAQLADDDWLGHDRFIVSSYFDLGAGMTFSLSRSLDLNATWFSTVSGTRGAHDARMLAIGMTWGFGAHDDAFSIFAPGQTEDDQR